MVRAIITWSLHNRLIVLVGTLLLIVVGLYCAYHLNVEAYPDPTPPLVEVITQNPGASPEEIERLICIPIEIALNGMPGLHHLRSTTIPGLNDIKCVFTYGTGGPLGSQGGQLGQDHRHRSGPTGGLGSARLLSPQGCAWD